MKSRPPAAPIPWSQTPAPIPCGGCSTKDAPVMLEAVPDTLDQTVAPLPAWTWRHLSGPCEWSRTLRAA